MGNKQCPIRFDGSNSSRVTLRNRRFLRMILSLVHRVDYSPKQSPTQSFPDNTRPIDNEHPSDTAELMQIDVIYEVEMLLDHHITHMEMEENQHSIIHPPASSILRHSPRVTRLPRPLSTQMQRPTPDYSESKERGDMKTGKTTVRTVPLVEGNRSSPA